MTSIVAAQPDAALAAPSRAETAELAIRTVGLVKRFGRRAAVDGLDLAVPRGRTYGLIGLNGAGKSTALRMIMGFLAPSAGRIFIGDDEMPRARAKLMRSIGYVPDRPTAYGWMRVAEAIEFSRKLRPGWDSARAEAMLKRYQLDPTQRIRKLSKGQGAKVSLLLALAHDPALLILDEPTDGLDPIARDDFLEHVLSSVCDKPRTVLMSSHNLADLQRIADVIGIMYEGKLLVQMQAEELLARTKRIAAVLADPAHPPALPPGAVCTRASGREWSVTVSGEPGAALAAVRAAPGVVRAEIVDLSLEEVFKDFVRGRQARQEVPA